jgi:hypothetical protein
MTDSSSETLETGVAAVSDVNTAATPSTPQTPPSDASADSSSASQGPTSMLDAVKSALQPETKEESAPSQTPEKPEAEVKAEADPDELSEEEQRDLKPKTQRRIQTLLDRTKTLTSDIEAMRPKVESYERLEQFVTSRGLSETEVADGFELMGLVKTRPDVALARLEPLVAQLRQITGQTLPPDLAEQVRLGYVTEQAAQELSQLRAKSNLTSAQLQQQQQQSEQERLQRERTEAISTAKDAGTAWETAKRQSDPDWNLKQDRIHELVELELRRRSSEGQPMPNKVQTIEMLDGIYDRVTKEVKRFQPRPSAVEPPVRGGRQSSETAAEPKSLLEAVQFSLKKAV